jgi:ABC-type Fe3+ transport system substrate-binding protein
MLAVLVNGTTDPKTWADLAKGKLRRKLPALREVLAGRFRDHHAFLARQHLAHLDDLDEAITMVSERIAEALGTIGWT